MFFHWNFHKLFHASFHCTQVVREKIFTEIFTFSLFHIFTFSPVRFFHFFTFSPSHFFTFSHFHFFTCSLFHILTLSLLHCFALLLFHFFTFSLFRCCFNFLTQTIFSRVRLFFVSFVPMSFPVFWYPGDGPFRNLHFLISWDWFIGNRYFLLPCGWTCYTTMVFHFRGILLLGVDVLWFPDRYGLGKSSRHTTLY